MEPFLEPIRTPFYSDALTQEQLSILGEYLILDESHRQIVGETSCGSYSSVHHPTIGNSPQAGQNVAASSSAIILSEKRTKRAGQSANGKKKRNQRTAFSNEQVTELEQTFNRKQHLTLDDLAMLSDQLGLSNKTVSRC